MNEAAQCRADMQRLREHAHVLHNALRAVDGLFDQRTWSGGGAPHAINEWRAMKRRIESVLRNAEAQAPDLIRTAERHDAHNRHGSATRY